MKAHNVLAIPVIAAISSIIVQTEFRSSAVAGDQRCYTLQNTANRTVSISFTYLSPTEPKPITPKVVPLAGNSSYQVCNDPGSSVLVTVTPGRWKEVSAQESWALPLGGLVPPGTYHIVDASPIAMPDFPEAWTPWCSDHHWRCKFLKAPDYWNVGSCVLTHVRIIVNSVGYGKFEALLGVAQTYSGDVWHTNIALHAGDRGVKVRDGHYDSQRVGSRSTVRWQNDHDFHIDPHDFDSVTAATLENNTC